MTRLHPRVAPGGSDLLRPLDRVANAGSGELTEPSPFLSIESSLRAVAGCPIAVAIRLIDLVLRPHQDGDLGRWILWMLTALARRYHHHNGTSEHVWRGRFKAFPVQDDHHRLAVLRSVEGNASRPDLVSSSFGVGEPRASLQRSRTP